MISGVPARLFVEQRLYDDDLFFVVRDAEPVVPEHLLIISKLPIASLADAPHGAVGEAVKRAAATLQLDGVWLFERGRAPFCTTMGADHRAHGHLVPSTMGSSVTFPVASSVFADIDSGLAGARTLRGQYLLWGGCAGPIRLATVAETTEKRLVRHALVAALGA